jgi:tRNA dimethylallyltransferase
VRALAVWKGTGTPLSVWQQRQGQGADYVFYKVGILPERDDLHRRIEARWNEMLEIGLEDELRSLQKKGYTAEMPGLQGLGIAAFFDYFAGKLTREQALEAGVVAHRQYAKRQCTWLRNSYHADKILAKAELEDVKMLVVSAFNVPR